MKALKLATSPHLLYLLPAATLGVSVLTNPAFPDPTGEIVVLSSTVTFGSIICSFVGMSMSVLIGLDTPILRRIRSNRLVLCNFRDILGLTFGVGILLVFGCLVLMFADLTFTIHVWLPLVVLCLSSLIRLAGFMLMLFTASEDALYPPKLPHKEK